MIDVETATPRVKPSVSSNATRTLRSSLPVAWLCCLLQDSIVCKLASYMQIKSSPWALALGQLDPPLSKALAWDKPSAPHGESGESGEGSPLFSPQRSWQKVGALHV